MLWLTNFVILRLSGSFLCARHYVLTLKCLHINVFFWKAFNPFIRVMNTFMCQKREEEKQMATYFTDGNGTATVMMVAWTIKAGMDSILREQVKWGDVTLLRLQVRTTLIHCTGVEKMSQLRVVAVSQRCPKLIVEHLRSIAETVQCRHTVTFNN